MPPGGIRVWTQPCLPPPFPFHRCLAWFKGKPPPTCAVSPEPGGGGRQLPGTEFSVKAGAQGRTPGRSLRPPHLIRSLSAFFTAARSSSLDRRRASRSLAPSLRLRRSSAASCRWASRPSWLSRTLRWASSSSRRSPSRASSSRRSWVRSSSACGDPGGHWAGPGPTQAGPWRKPSHPQALGHGAPAPSLCLHSAHRREL